MEKQPDKANAEGTQLFMKLGLTQTQARLYLELLSLKEAKAGTLAENMALQSAEIYRALKELHLKGLIEKQISTPTIFTAVPIDSAFKLLIRSEKNKLFELQEISEKFLSKNGKNFEKQGFDLKKYNINVIKGKERIIEKISELNSNACKSIRILTTLPLWFQILHFCFESYKVALARGVTFEVIIAEKRVRLNEQLRFLLNEPGFKLFIARDPLKTNGAIFDAHMACISFLPGSFLSSPFIYTNHVSLVSMLEDHFENTLHFSHEYKRQNNDVVEAPAWPPYHQS